MGVVACNGKKATGVPIPTAAIERRDIIVDASATGAVEPINVVEVKSKASGQITQMPVETGTLVKPGDLIVQLDTRDVKNQYDQTLADVRAAEARSKVSEAQKKRSDDLFAARIVTAQEHETAALDYANAEAQLVRARTNLDLAQQRLEDATGRAPSSGPVVGQTVSVGQVVSAGTHSRGGGTAWFKRAVLHQVRVRGDVSDAQLRRLLRLAREGMREKGRPRATKPAVEVVRQLDKDAILKVTLLEGRNRQVRLMCEEVGLRVVALKRLSFGPVSIRRLPQGAVRTLERRELERLEALTKGKA